MSCVPSQQEGSDQRKRRVRHCVSPITYMYEMFSKLSLIPEDTQDAPFTVPERHVGGLQDLTGQPVSGPAYPSRNVANSSPPLCLLRGEGGSSISTHEEANSSCPIPVPRAKPGASACPSPCGWYSQPTKPL